MEIVRVNAGARNIDRSDVKCLHVYDAILYLQSTLNVEEAVARDNNAVALKQVWRDDDVGDSSLIFQREKDEALGCSRSLTGDDASRNANEAVVGASEFVSGEKTASLQNGTMVRHGMRPAGKTHACEICSESLIRRHFAKRY